MNNNQVQSDKRLITQNEPEYEHIALISAMKLFGYRVSLYEARKLVGYPKPDAIRHLLEEKELDQDIISTGYIYKIQKAFLAELVNLSKMNSDLIAS
jgi:hypothetical protein